MISITLMTTTWEKTSKKRSFGTMTISNGGKENAIWLIMETFSRKTDIDLGKSKWSMKEMRAGKCKSSEKLTKDCKKLKTEEIGKQSWLKEQLCALKVQRSLLKMKKASLNFKNKLKLILSFSNIKDKKNQFPRYYLSGLLIVIKPKDEIFNMNEVQLKQLIALC